MMDYDDMSNRMSVIPEAFEYFFFKKVGCVHILDRRVHVFHGYFTQFTTISNAADDFFQNLSEMPNRRRITHGSLLDCMPTNQNK